MHFLLFACFVVLCFHGCYHPCVYVFLKCDKIPFFSEENKSADGVLTLSLQTSENQIDRENSQILKEGGLYTFTVSLHLVLTYECLIL